MSKNNQYYEGNANLKNKNVSINFTEEQVQEYIKCANNPIYFIEKYIKIVNMDEGLVSFKMYPFQKEIVKTIHNNRFVICKIPRQSGKSTTLVGYLLHYCIFNENMSVAMLANKESVAKLQLERFKTAYEHLPTWLQQGVIEWNKLSVRFENGSKLTVAATSSSAIRGGSFNTVVLDEFAYINNNIAQDFFSSVFPTISSGKQSKMVIISTPKGMNHFYKIWIDAVNKKNEYIPIECHWYDVPGRDAKFKKTMIAQTSQSQWNVEFECNFIGSDNTLINPSILSNLSFATPMHSSIEGLDIYEPPKEDHIYTICVDTGKGSGDDYHAFVILDCTTCPYKVVAKFRNNTISHQLYPTYIGKLGIQYNEAYILMELNDLGMAAAEILQKEIEYPNIITTSLNNRKGQSADGGFSPGKAQLGVRVGHVVKRTGCMVLKDLIENEKIILNDFNIINELSTYISKSQSWEATEGYNDDLVSCLVIFGWLSTQVYFKDYTNTDSRKKMFENQIKKIEEDILPFGFINDGFNDPFDEENVFDESQTKKSPKKELEDW